MSQTPITIDFELKELLTNLGGKIDALQADVSEIKADVKVLHTEVTNIKKDITEIKGTQGKQLWTLLGIIATAVIGGLVVAIWRTAIAANI